MALASTDLGGRMVYPFRLVPPNKPNIKSVSGGRLAKLP